jgi:hypothetical protein
LLLPEWYWPECKIPEGDFVRFGSGVFLNGKNALCGELFFWENVKKVKNSDIFLYSG